MNDDLKQALITRLTAMGDDELILGHRNSEWCGHAPILEEDIAFANIALDEIGHAALWYEALADLTGEDPDAYPDQLAFHRDPVDFRCVQLVELPTGDWAFSMLRQYFFDVYESLLMEHLATSEFTPFADAAAKLRKEETYHLRHTALWVRRLGLGTDESNRRMQDALHELWPYAFQLFVPATGDVPLIEADVFPDVEELRGEWEPRVRAHLTDAGLDIPSQVAPPAVSRADHSEHLPDLLAEMQKVARLDPNAEW